jgi:hypothetical protein
MSAFVVIGAVAVLAGLGLLTVAIRHHGERLPRHVAMLIGGMMLTAFGLVIAGFAIVYQATAPLAFNAGGAR